MSQTLNNKLRFAGDVSILEARLTSVASGFNVDIQNMLVSVNIYEDMFSPFITGTIVVTDSIDLMNSFPFLGHEYINLKIETPTINDDTNTKSNVIDQTFYIYKITDRTYMAERNVVYEMHFFSQEMSVDANVSLSKGFSGKVSDIAREILGTSGLGTNRLGYIEETKNSTKYVSNFWKPTKNLNFLTNQAINANGSPSYLFFENRTGFNFVSLDTLCRYEPIQNFNYGSFVRDVNKYTASRDINKDYQRINELAIPDVVDSLSKLTNGAYASTLFTHDLVSKRYRVKTFDYLQDFEKENHLNKFPITNKRVASVLTLPSAKIISNEIHYGVFNGFGDVSNSSTLQNRLSRLQQIENHKIKIVVPGRTDYTVGRTVELTLFQAEHISIKNGLDDNRDKVFSGRYLIAAIHHSITRERHECVMEVIKDTFIKDVAKIGEA